MGREVRDYRSRRRYECARLTEKAKKNDARRRYTIKSQQGRPVVKGERVEKKDALESSPKGRENVERDRPRRRKGGAVLNQEKKTSASYQNLSAIIADQTGGGGHALEEPSPDGGGGKKKLKRRGPFEVGWERWN